MSVPADPAPSALARWWWRTPVWSRLLTSLGGGFTVLMILTGLFGPTAPAQPPGGQQPVVATVATTSTTTSTTTPSSTTPTTTTETTTTTTEPPTTTTEAPAPPPPATHQPPPTTYQAPPPTENPGPPPSEPVYVTPGAFCSTEGATGVSKTGKPMVCKRTATDPKLRWRAA